MHTIFQNKTSKVFYSSTSTTWLSFPFSVRHSQFTMCQSISHWVWKEEVVHHVTEYHSLGVEGRAHHVSEYHSLGVEGRASSPCFRISLTWCGRKSSPCVRVLLTETWIHILIFHYASSYCWISGFVILACHVVSALSLTRFQLSGTNSLFLSTIPPLSALLNLPWKPFSF